MSVRKLPKVSFEQNEVSYFFPEEGGFIEPDDNEQTYQISQKEIVNAVDITSAAKHFELNLPHLGPYKIDYFRNGRNLLIGGRNGHVAVFDWITKDLACEFNVQESVHAVQWLHMPTMYAVAQADWTYVYDENGTQIHCLKRLYQAYELDFLPYHFLLVAASDNGFLSWLDISVGNMVANYRMKVPRVTALTHNPANAITLTGHPNGTVRMWSPNVNEPLVQMLCHPAAVRDVVVDKRGLYMVTTSADRSVRLWDVRNFKCLHNFKLRSTPSRVALSHKNILAIASGNVVEMYRNFNNKIDKPYMRHRLDSKTSVISSLQFCPFEDVLGVGHRDGFTSLLVPGSGEPNFDAFEANPYMSKSQRREMEVKALLEKINHELITLDPEILAKVSNKQRAPNRYREVMREAELKSKQAKATTSLFDSDDELGDEAKGKPTTSITRSRPKNKSKKKKIGAKMRSKSAKQEEIRRRLAKEGAQRHKAKMLKNKKNDN